MFINFGQALLQTFPTGRGSGKFGPSRVDGGFFLLLFFSPDHSSDVMEGDIISRYLSHEKKENVPCQGPASLNHPNSRFTVRKFVLHPLIDFHCMFLACARPWVIRFSPFMHLTIPSYRVATPVKCICVCIIYKRNSFAIHSQKKSHHHAR